MNILLLEDDPEVSEFISQALLQEGFEVTTCIDLPMLENTLSSKLFDCLLLDRHLPSGDSAAWVTSLTQRAMHLPPVLFLTALDSLDDKLTGLAVGDDYLIKPFDVPELIARIKALIRRQTKLSPTLSAAGIVLNRIDRTVTRFAQTIELNAMEFKLLDYLLANQGQIVSRKMLLQHVWQYNFEPATSIVETYISRLRNKLMIDGYSDPIETIRGMGYRLNAQ